MTQSITASLTEKQAAQGPYIVRLTTCSACGQSQIAVLNILNGNKRDPVEDYLIPHRSLVNPLRLCPGSSQKIADND